MVVIETYVLEALLQRKFCFQAQISYTKTSGEKYIKSITVAKQMSTSRDDSEKDVDSTVIALQAVQDSARMAQAGNGMKV